jgi:hypothetical protein
VSEETARTGAVPEGPGAGVDPVSVSLAPAKFAEAQKYAPNWGRLNFKWGEALSYAGKMNEAAQPSCPHRRLRSPPSEKPNWQG